ncbi:hypothetical protein PRIPAC_77647 [Pristionchus pacificus]|uniref:Uncharacterized protein n=1 Tax=Pristionchus pacificus TaxID=54126 RepID=A0A2A6C2D1_PRIPA|nr:hypothetical protein PRIPAC_77647 [Pristionchus pacificus]|eukprot:PDM72392.1 hypothetical protein PRIPAC_38826 [Pristionchus pacificus]
MLIDMEFLKTYPINHPIEALFCLCSLIPSSVLLIVVQKSTMHPNCRALISLWTCTQILMNLAMLTYCYYFIFIDHEVYPKTQFYPPIRTFFTEQAIRMWCMCSCFELGISLERELSIRVPHEYHITPRSTKYIVGLAISANDDDQVEEEIEGEMDDEEDLVQCGRNVHRMIHVQIQETYNVARAMLPVYLFSFIFKFFAVSTASVSSVFLLRHNSLRHRTQILRIYEKRQTKCTEEESTQHHTLTHFELLDSMWK